MKTQTVNRINNRPAPQNRQTGGLDLSALKLTALHYLAEARAKEDYEQMGQIVHYAGEFGAGFEEINKILAQA